MIVTSFEFALFFTLVFIVRICLRGFNAEKWLLLIASLVFYVSWSLPCLPLIVFTSLVDWSIARKLGQTTDQARRKRLLVTSLSLSLGLLGFFKYSNFLLENLRAVLGVLGWKIGAIHYDIALPPGISFYTFASMAYVLDVYYERIPICGNARDFALFVAFFPKLLSGPITRGGELLSQFKDRVRATAEDIEVGVSYVLMGAVKKLVVADQIAPHVNLIFASPTQFDGVTLLMGAMGYTVQIYCDFAGYSDIAIGCARILGFRLPENFQMPFSSRNITEFWRRWHISLSRWFRDYLFLPLEIATRNNPNAALRASINMMITMLLCGLWHGPSWNFVIWGGIHGAALAVHKVWTTWKPMAAMKNHGLYQRAASICSHLLTLSVILLSMIFFRAQSLSDAASYLGRLLSWAGSGTRLDSPFILGAVVAVLLIHLVVRKDRNLALELPQMSIGARIAGYSGLLLLVVLLGATESSPFVYFQF